MTLPRSRYAGIPYEMPSSASGTMLRMVCRSSCRVVRLGSSRFAKYSSTSCCDMRSMLHSLRGWGPTPLAAYALAKVAVEGDLCEGALENGQLLVVQLGKE